MMKPAERKWFVLLLIILFIFRTLFGLASDFWFTDELQIYLIGLKSFTTHTWPYYGPDVVYTNTQIPGALQGLLISGAFFIASIPEAPVILLNILSFGSLSLLAWYISRRIPAIPVWITFAWVLMLSWTLGLSTHCINTSYVIIFSIPFFLAAIDLIQIYPKPLLPKKLAFFMLGSSFFLVMQLHLSYVLLIPFVITAFYFEIREKTVIKTKFFNLLFFVIGAALGMITLIPTLFLEDNRAMATNIVFNWDNLKNTFDIFIRYLSFASSEIHYFLGSPSHRYQVIGEILWVVPFGVYLLLLYFILILMYVFIFFRNKERGAWKRIKWLTFGTFVMIWASFFFSVKGPSSHTFYLLLPIPLLYSFHCFEWIIARFPVWKKIMAGALVCTFFFYSGLGYYSLRHKSLYLDRARVVKAIEKNDYRILGERRLKAKY